MWQPYFNRLVELAKNAQKEHKTVLITFSLAGVGPDGKEWLDSQLEGLKHIHIEVPREELLRRFFDRNDKYLA